MTGIVIWHFIVQVLTCERKCQFLKHSWTHINAIETSAYSLGIVSFDRYELLHAVTHSDHFSIF